MSAKPTKNLLTPIRRWFRRHWDALSWGFVSLTTGLTLVLGVIGFSGNEMVATPISTRIYLAFQLLTLESGAFQDQSSVSWPLEVARWTGVITSLGIVMNTLVAVFSRQIGAFLLRRLTRHAVVIGLNPDSTQLASDLLDGGYRVTVINDEEANPEITVLIERGASEVIGDAQEPEILAAAAVHNAEVVVIFDGSDTRNLEILLAISQSLDQRPLEFAPLQCHVHAIDERLQELLELHVRDKATASKLETTSFNRFTNSVRLLLAKTPLDRERIVSGDRRHVHLVIAELNSLGEALLKQALAIGHFANDNPLRITVIDESASRKEESLLTRIPEFHDCGEITFIDGFLDQMAVRNRLRELLEEPMEMVSIAICQEDSQLALTSCMDLIPLLTATNNTVFVNLAEDERVAALLELVPEATIHLFPFGTAQDACSATSVIQKDLDTLAQLIHNEYCAKRTCDGDTVADFPAMRPWNQLAADLRDSNRQQADHIFVKLRTLGYQLVAGSAADDGMSFQPGEEEIEALARAEHRRWCCNRT
ncbi:MAG: NAD-binding protein, partial [Planctomycetaceae bacterium]